MARYVLLEFDDNEEASRFVEQHLVPFASNGPIVRGVYAKPTQFCTCKSSPGQTRGSRLGWWVCTNCKKPRVRMTQMPRNLLEGSAPEGGTRVWYTVSVHPYKAEQAADGTIEGWVAPDKKE